MNRAPGPQRSEDTLGERRVVMETLGHSANAVTMNTYGHVMQHRQGEAADRMDELLQ